MIDNPVFEEALGDLKVRVFVDDNPLNPREESECHLGTMVCFHSRYNLGDDVEGYQYDCAAAFSDWLKVNRKSVVVLPVFIYDHSGITIRTEGFYSTWDSGQVGWIFASREDILEAYGRKRLTAKLRRRVETTLRAEVKEYDQYLTGDIYGFTVTREETCDGCGHTEDVDIDSCWGYYGLEWAKTAALDAAKWEAKQAEAA